MVVSARVVGVAGSCVSFDLVVARVFVLTLPATRGTGTEAVVRLSAFLVGGSAAEVSMGLSLPAACALRFRNTGDVVEGVDACKSRQSGDETCTILH